MKENFSERPNRSKKRIWIAAAAAGAVLIAGAVCAAALRSVNTPDTEDGYRDAFSHSGRRRSNASGSGVFRSAAADTDAGAVQGIIGTLLRGLGSDRLSV